MSSEEDFDLDDCYRQLRDAWPNNARTKRAGMQERSVFDEKVVDRAAWEAVWEKAQYDISDGVGSQSLSQWLIARFPRGAVSPARSVAPKSVVTTEAPAPPPEDDGLNHLRLPTLYGDRPERKNINRAFSLAWSEWPKNIEFPERMEKALGAFSTAACTVPLDDLLKTCLFYSKTYNDPSSGMMNPSHMSTILGDDEKLEVWRMKAAFSPTAEDLAIFETTWAWYPKFVGKSKEQSKRDGLSYWVRHIKPEDRWAFLSAVKKYRSERREDDSADSIQYTQGFVKFVGGWEEFRYFRVWAGDVSAAAAKFLEEENLFRTIGLMAWAHNMHSFIAASIKKFGGVKPAVEHMLRYVLESNRTGRVPRPDLEAPEGFDALVKKICDKAWNDACRPPKGVIGF